MAGSQDIPITILEKISNADVFVCDITTMDGDAPERQRKVPNPNVMVELGYAIAHLGWERIIMLFNKAFGRFPEDAPFDIDRHRASPYTYRVAVDNRDYLNQLMIEALRIIVNKRPARPDNENALTPEQKKRRRDISTLKTIMSTINLPTMDMHIERHLTGLIAGFSISGKVLTE